MPETDFSNLDYTWGKSFHPSSTPNIPDALLAAAANGDAMAQLLCSLKFDGYEALSDQVGQCGASAISRRATIRVSESGAIRAGVKWCRKHLCPLCGQHQAHKLYHELTERAAQIGDDADHFFITFTAPHTDDLRAQFKAMSGAFQVMGQRRQWRRAVAGYIRLVDIKGDNDRWHPHLHAVVSLNATINSSAFFEWIHSMWARQILKRLDARCRPDAAVHIEPVRHLGKVINYLTRAKAVAEPTVEIDGISERQAPWHLPASAYADLLQASHGIHWFNAGGIWKTPKRAKGARYPTPGDLIISGNEWQGIAHNERHLLRHGLKLAGAAGPDAVKAVAAGLL